MKIYLASRYSRRLELCEYREALIALGHTVTSRWLNGTHQISRDGKPIGDNGEALVEGSDNQSCEVAANLRADFALEDFSDVMAADWLIAFTEPPKSDASRGGRHVELGMAIAAGKVISVIGHRENLFCWLPRVGFYSDFDSFLPVAKALV